MLSWSARRRIGYFAFTATILAVLAAGAYLFYKPVPSCFDGKQNQDEVGVDCGGACAQVCPLEVVPLRVLWSRLFMVAPGKYDVAALIKNSNPKHGTQPFDYVFKVWDANGLLVSTRRGSAFAGAREEFVVFESRIDAGARTPVRADFEIAEVPTWFKAASESPALTVRRKDFANLPTPRLVAILKNDSLDELGGFSVVAVLSDEAENAVAISSTYVESLAGGAETELVFTWPEPLKANVAFIDLYPHLEAKPRR